MQTYKTMKLRNTVFCLLLLAGFSASCIREDLSDCYSTNTLQLSYKGDGETEIFGDKICRVEMYVFDSENQCVANGVLPQEQVDARIARLPELRAGTYRIVCLGNTHHTQVADVASCDFSRITFADGDYLAGESVSGNDSLYYATTAFTVEPFTGKNDDKTQVVEFASSHYDVAVEVAGIPGTEQRTAAAALPTLEICGVSPCTDFENRACGEATDYLLETQYDGGSRMLTARTNIMRHTDHANVNVCLRSPDGGTLLAEVNLAEFLAANPEVDCSRNEVLIPIRMEFVSGEVVVTVPEWYEEDVKPEF